MLILPFTVKQHIGIGIHFTSQPIFLDTDYLLFLFFHLFRQVFVPLSLINTYERNIVAVLTKNSDQWAFFDMQISARYISRIGMSPSHIIPLLPLLPLSLLSPF